MTDTIQPQPFVHPFDERSALKELEQLADKIQLSRRQREEKVAEFDAFVRTFRQDRYAASIAASEGELRRVEASDREQRRVEDRPAVASAATHAARGVTPSLDTGPASSVTVAPPAVPVSTPWGVAAESEPVFLSAAARPVRPRAAFIGVSLAALAVVVVGVMLWQSAGALDTPATQSGPLPTVPAASTAQRPPPGAAPSAVTAPAPPAAVPAGPPRALNVELVTVRPVWARITVDGRRAMEREFSADQRFPFAADRVIVVRAGDAGAIRLVVDGKDLGVLGRDGQVFERVFTPQTPAR